MTGFEFCAPTKVVFGVGAEKKTGALTAAAGAKKALVHFSPSAQKSGLVDRVCAALTEAKVGYVTLGGIQPNPRLELVYQGIELCEKENVDFLLAIGGGSSIDSAKAIGYGLASGGDVWDFYCGKRAASARTPLGCVLTIAAAGSEMSNSSVITNVATGEKRGYNNEIGRPVFAVMDPSLTLTVPPYHTAAGCADILMHTMERYFTAESETLEVTDALAESLLRTVMKNARLLARDAQNLPARAEVMWAGALSHNGLTGCGSGAGDWAPHQLGHEISGKYNISHGVSLTSVWGSWARYVYKENPARFARFALNVMELPRGGSDEELALAAIAEMEEFFWAIEMPVNLNEAGIHPQEDDIRQMARGCSRNGARTVGGFKELSETDMAAIYKMACGNG